MAHSLDVILEPGERVIYRDPTSWAPRSWHADLATLGLVSALGLALDLGQLATILVLAVHGLGWLGQAFGALTSWSVVTSRRVLQKSGWRRPEVNDVHFAEVTAVAFRPSDFPGTVRIQMRDGGETDLRPLNDPQAFAAAAADVAGVKRPAPVGCLINMTPYLGPFGGILIPSLVPLGLIVLARLMSLDSIINETSVLSGLLVVLSVPLFMLFVYLGFPIGIHLASLLGIGILRPFATFEHVRNAIDMRFWFDPAKQPPDRVARVYLRWIAFLYGRPVTGDAGAETHHGR